VLVSDLTARLPTGRSQAGDYMDIERLARFEQLSDRDVWYRFDFQQAHAAFEAGLTADEVLTMLERLSCKPVPSALAEQWRAWWSRYARTRLYDGLTVIEFADDYILQELLSQTDLQEHLLFTFGPRLVAVRPESADAIARQLVKKGYTPKLA
jgi:hypothetical protein